jgi:polyisoprenoid-binding protein YceI
MFTRLALTTLTLLGLHPALLDARSFEINEQRSTITLTVAATGHQIEGHVISFEADIDFPHKDAFPDSAIVRIQADRITTDHEERDIEMMKWLEVEKYPELVFELDYWEGTGSTRIAYGSLTLHGVTRGIAIPVTVSTLGSQITLIGAKVRA